MTVATGELFTDVVGQPDAVGELRSAVSRPLHAYLFVGPAGCGKRAAARAFAAALVADDAARRGDDDQRAARLALADQHPDVHVIAPEGARLLVDEAREIVRLAARSPVEGDRKVIVLDEAHRMEVFGAVLLKAIEEPPPSTVFVILADEVVPDLVTIASRSVRIDFGPVAETAVVERLEAEGVPSEVAEQAASVAGGDLSRARLLSTDEALGARVEAWRSVPSRLEYTGAMAAMLADELLAMIDDAQGALDERQGQERAELSERLAATGERGSLLKEQQTRHKREVRRHRTQELRMGLGTLAGVYRDGLVDAADPEPLVEALRRIQAAAEALVRNPNERLLLLNLFAHLPPV